jgi:hypothetical protein
MPHAPIVPDRKVVLSPLEAHLSIMVLGEQVENIAQKKIGLVLRHAIDALGEAFVDIYGFPASNSYGDLASATCCSLCEQLTVGADDRMDSTQRFSEIQWIASSALSNGVPKSLCLLQKELCVVCRCQALQKLLHCG